MAQEITAHEAALRLRDWGYFGDPRNGSEIVADIHEWDDPQLMEAVEDWQQRYKADLDILTHKHHGRASMPDGYTGPATRELLSVPRCGVPDTLVLEANWPTACRNLLTFSPLFAQLAPLSAQATRQAFADACASWTKVVELMLALSTAGRQAHIWAEAGPLGGSVLAWSYLAQNSCAVHLQQRYNTAVNWSQRYLQAVSAHELGHALGLPHSNERAALMYPYARPDSVYLPGEVDIRNMVELGYRRRDGAPPPPPPPPGPRQLRSLSAHWTDGTVEEFTRAGVPSGGTDWE